VSAEFAGVQRLIADASATKQPDSFAVTPVVSPQVAAVRTAIPLPLPLPKSESPELPPESPELLPKPSTLNTEEKEPKTNFDRTLLRIFSSWQKNGRDSALKFGVRFNEEH
jgi:hypothetical protein